MDSQVNFHGLKVTRRGLDHHRDVGFYEETRQVNLLPDRKKTNFLVKENPRRRGGDKRLEDDVDEKARGEANDDFPRARNRNVHKEALFCLGLDRLEVFGLAQQVVVN